MPLLFSRFLHQKILLQSPQVPTAQLKLFNILITWILWEIIRYWVHQVATSEIKIHTSRHRIGRLLSWYWNRIAFLKTSKNVLRYSIFQIEDVYWVYSLIKDQAKQLHPSIWRKGYLNFNIACMSCLNHILPGCLSNSLYSMDFGHQPLRERNWCNRTSNI